MKILLISGVPAMGKTTLGNYLEEKHQYKHIDLSKLEKPLVEESEQENLKSQLNALTNAHRNIVITWGFGPGIPSHENIINMILGMNAIMIWFDGNRKAAKEAFIRRGGHTEKEFDDQVRQINQMNTINTYKPKIINTFKENGMFRNMDDVVNDIFGTLA